MANSSRSLSTIRGVVTIVSSFRFVLILTQATMEITFAKTGNGSISD